MSDEKSLSDRLREAYASDLAKFERISLAGLRNIYDGLTAAIEGFVGIYNRPCFEVDLAEGKWMSCETDRLHGLRAAIVMHVDERLLTDRDDFEAYRDILTQYEAECGSETDEWFKLICKLEQRLAAIPGERSTFPSPTVSLAIN